MSVDDCFFEAKKEKSEENVDFLRGIVSYLTKKRQYFTDYTLFTTRKVIVNKR
jgi:hypothetical protein